MTGEHCSPLHPSRRAAVGSALAVGGGRGIQTEFARFVPNCAKTRNWQGKTIVKHGKNVIMIFVWCRFGALSFPAVRREKDDWARCENVCTQTAHRSCAENILTNCRTSPVAIRSKTAAVDRPCTALGPPARRLPGGLPRRGKAALRRAAL